MNKKKIVTLPLAVVTLGAIAGCNSTSEIKAAAQNSSYFYDFKNEEYEEYFKLPSGLKTLDTSIAKYALQNAKAKMYKAKTITDNEFEGYYSDTSYAFNEKSPTNIQGFGEATAELVAKRYEALPSGQSKYRNISLFNGVLLNDGVTLPASGSKTKQTDETKRSLTLYKDGNLGLNMSYKTSVLVDDEIKSDSINESYNTIIYTKSDDKKAGIYNEISSKYFELPANYNETYLEFESDDPAAAEKELKTRLTDYFNTYKFQAVDDLGNNLLDSEDSTGESGNIGTTIAGIASAGTGTAIWSGGTGVIVPTINEEKIPTGTEVLYNDKEMYIYEYGADKDMSRYSHYRYYPMYLISQFNHGGNYIDVSPLRKQVELSIANSDSIFFNSYMGGDLIDTYATYLMRTAMDEVDKHDSDRDMDKQISLLEEQIEFIGNVPLMESNPMMEDLMQNKHFLTLMKFGMLLQELETQGISLIQNPLNTLSQLDIMTKIDCDYGTFFNYFIPVYNGNESVVKLVKEESSGDWLISSISDKKSRYLLKNEKGVVLDDPITYYADYNVIKFDYNEVEAPTFKESETFENPYSIYSTTGGAIAAAKVIESVEDAKKGSEYYTKDYIYNPKRYGIYDNSMYDWQVQTNLKEKNVHVYRGYISNASQIGLHIFDNNSEELEPKLFVGYEDLTSANTKTIGSGEVYDREVEEKDQQHFIKHEVSSGDVYVVLYVQFTAEGPKVYKDGKNYGLILNFDNANNTGAPVNKLENL